MGNLYTRVVNDVTGVAIKKLGTSVERAQELVGADGVNEYLILRHVDGRRVLTQGCGVSIYNVENFADIKVIQDRFEYLRDVEDLFKAVYGDDY